ncbi:MAG: aminoglycoside phosphotransferase [Thiobacillus sp. 63-78]|uniref:aminoglycoside phosphotransferase family protein n=1 Tax=Thiobacillus sp. 63-78 TaxID=1895859 RepID=UPI00095F74D1|nr:phosphotransferase [Thiobacillus sp. 63-78]MBN8763678.1 phosphotransferase [Thiobacillus sp.]MBN8774464.1 phosphotransferase [Thiobacillus sp.]OJZ15755.1 MAG: aminoglycoside phosphotransferase [Thiobacillus sp. 63-78]
MERVQALQDWAARQLGGGSLDIAPASADASFRRYFRVTVKGRDYIVMDAPPAHEDCRPFIAVARLFADAGVNVPQVLAQDLDRGFLLLTDLGNTTYLSALNEAALDQGVANGLYLASNDALIRIQQASRPGVLAEYDRTLLTRELMLFPEWYVAKHLGVAMKDDQKTLLDTVFERLLANNLAQPQVYVHRDWHSRNLMVSDPTPGILDFQDAVYGPITYDLASIYRDAYVQWDEEMQLDWVIRYWEKARAARLPVREDFGEFWRDFEWMGAQRQIKVLGIFARLYHRDSKDGYLKDMPRVMHYLRRVCERYDELKPLLFLLDGLENREVKVGYTF